MFTLLLSPQMFLDIKTFPFILYFFITKEHVKYILISRSYLFVT